MSRRSLAIAAATLVVACGDSSGDNAPADASTGSAVAVLPWPAMYQRAAQLFGEGRHDEAVTLFYVAQLRGRIAVRCQDVTADREPALLSSFNATVGQTINEYAGGSPHEWAQAIDRALAFDETHPDPSADNATCRAERDRQRTGLADLRDHILANVDEIRRQRAANGLPNR